MMDGRTRWLGSIGVRSRGFSYVLFYMLTCMVMTGLGHGIGFWSFGWGQGYMVFYRKFLFLFSRRQELGNSLSCQWSRGRVRGEPSYMAG